jgi:hypothetical protein
MLTARDGLMMALAILGAAGAGPASATEGIGLRAYAEDTIWPRWQARLLTISSFSLWRHAAAESDERRKITSLSLLGDYYVSRPALGAQRSGGLRATSGLILGALSGQALGGFEGRPARAAGYRFETYHPQNSRGRLDSAPYVGIGYTSFAARSGLGFSADVGLAARFGSAGDLGRALGGKSLEDTLRELRLTPLLSLGMSYSF